jgi:predicted kinase
VPSDVGWLLFGVRDAASRPSTTHRRGLSTHDRDRPAALAAGHAAIVDAVFAKPEEREAVAAIAREAGCRFVGLWLSAPAETLIERVEQRRGDASDANRRVVKEQLGYDLGEIAWLHVDTSGTP